MKVSFSVNQPSLRVGFKANPLLTHKQADMYIMALAKKGKNITQHDIDELLATIKLTKAQTNGNCIAQMLEMWGKDKGHIK